MDWINRYQSRIVTAEQAVETAQQLLKLSQLDQERIATLGRATPATLLIHRALMEQPLVTSRWLVGKTGITSATVNKALKHLEDLRIVKELTRMKRNRLFSYVSYIEVMNQGLELHN